MIVYIHTNKCNINGKQYSYEDTFKWLKKHRLVRDFWTRSHFWGNNNLAHLVDYHGVKVENTENPSRKYSCVEHRSDTKLPIKYSSDPNVWSGENVTIAKYCCKKGEEKM